MSNGVVLRQSGAQQELRAALADRSAEADERTRAALGMLCAEAQAKDAHIEHLVASLKQTWTETPVPEGVSPEDWHERYSAALVELLALYFGET